jgi:hypothetical protein
MEEYSILRNKRVNEVMLDNTITLKAKGLFSFIIAISENYHSGNGNVYLSLALLSTNLREGKEAIAGALNELIDAGYIDRQRLKDGSGKFEGYGYKINF